MASLPESCIGLPSLLPEGCKRSLSFVFLVIRPGGAQQQAPLPALRLGASVGGQISSWELVAVCCLKPIMLCTTDRTFSR